MTNERKYLILSMIHLAAREKLSHQNRPNLIELTKQYGKHFDLSDSEIESVLEMRVWDAYSH